MKHDAHITILFRCYSNKIQMSINIIRVINVTKNTKHTLSKDGQNKNLMKRQLCGVCKHEMSIQDYMMTELCPKCQAHFNSRCKFHYHLYFELNKGLVTIERLLLSLYTLFLLF